MLRTDLKSVRPAGSNIRLLVAWLRTNVQNFGSGFETAGRVDFWFNRFKIRHKYKPQAEEEQRSRLSLVCNAAFFAIIFRFRGDSTAARAARALRAANFPRCDAAGLLPASLSGSGDRSIRSPMDSSTICPARRFKSFGRCGLLERVVTMVLLLSQAGSFRRSHHGGSVVALQMSHKTVADYLSAAQQAIFYVTTVRL
jgi:hypothetical protein